MNSSTQAQKGFKTFILTLVISLVVFTAIYYVVNSGVDSADDTPFLSDENVAESVTDAADTSTLGDSSKRELASDTSTSEEEPKSVFQELATGDMSLEEPRMVLAGADTDTTADTTTVTDDDAAESTVPDTGLSGPTVGLFFSSIALAVFAYVMFVGPRKLALKSFEKNILDDLD